MGKMTIPQSSYPRERLLEYGASALSDQELLAIILRTGSHPYNVMELSGRLLKELGHLHELKCVTLEELQTIRGLGKVKSIELKAVVELGLRIQKASQPKYGAVRSSVEIASRLMEEMKDYAQEHLICLYLNTKNEIIQKQTLFIGSLNQSVAHPREIFRGAVRFSAARVLVTHNHPSGNPTPSAADIAFTKRLKSCGEMMGIELLDHLIIGDGVYTSLREEGLWED